MRDYAHEKHWGHLFKLLGSTYDNPKRGQSCRVALLFQNCANVG